jgi:hypothetical protein
MSAKAWTAALFLALLMAAPSVVADDRKDPEMSPEARIVAHLEDPKGWFAPDPAYEEGEYDGDEQLAIYNGKHMNRTASPIQHGIRLYDRGAYTPRPTWLGQRNPINYHFMAYGDLRIGGAYYDDGTTGSSGDSEQSVLAARLNLELDLALTATERIHAFVRPLDKNGSFTRYQISGGNGGNEFIDELDFKLETLFFEGDVNAIREGLTNRKTAFDLPLAFGRVPLFTQNGIWVNDAFDGLALALTARSSPKLDISNMDFTFFAGFDKVTTEAAPGDDSKVFGMAGFADALEGYIEYGYGYVAADDNDRSYHNVTAAFTRRYRPTSTIGLANSVRLIGNFGQQGSVKTADGLLVLVESSFFRKDPIFLVPYVNLFAGFDTPQPLARAAGTGGVLNNTGINFESDGLTGYPALDSSARESFGAAVGLEKLWGVSRQVIVEGAVVQRMGSGAPGNQYALGVRFQQPITNAWILRADAMHGWQEGQSDVYGIRVELRRKF